MQFLTEILHWFHPCSTNGHHTNGYHHDGLDEEVVITGLSGKFPECDSVEEFRQALFDGVDLVTDDERRWPKGNSKGYLMS